jgi:alkylhydroperoxidase family enzyme
MPRVREIEDDGGDPILKDVFTKEREIFGGLLNSTKVFAHCPPIMKAAKQLGNAIEKSGRLPAALLPLVYLRVALINGCPF